MAAAVGSGFPRFRPDLWVGPPGAVDGCRTVGRWIGHVMAMPMLPMQIRWALRVPRNGVLHANWLLVSRFNRTECQQLKIDCLRENRYHFSLDHFFLFFSQKIFRLSGIFLLEIEMGFVISASFPQI